jgi:hypothetical protein
VTTRKNGLTGISVNVSGNVTGSAIVAGNDAFVFQQSTQDAAISVTNELQAIGDLLQSLSTEPQANITTAIDGAAIESAKPQPNKEAVGNALECAIKYAKQTERFASIIDRLGPHVAAVANWLGVGWSSLMGLLSGP